MSNETLSARRTLNGWKEIAGYLGKSVRSVQRWELTLGLPVHRIRTSDGQIVYAYTDELDEWRSELDIAPQQDPSAAGDPSHTSSPATQTASSVSEAIQQTTARRVAPLVALLAAAVVFAAGAVWGHWHARANEIPTEFRVNGSTLQAMNANGAIVWTHRFGREVSFPSASARLMPHVVDLHDDGEPEVLAFIRFSRASRPPTRSDGVFCFRANGEVEWFVLPSETLSFAGEGYSAPWLIQDVVVSETSQPRRMWIALAHHTWWPAFVLEITAEGQSLVRYVQAGRLSSLAHWETPAGGVLAVGGATTNDRATIALLSDSDPPATFPDDGAGAHACDRCPTGRPRKVLQFEQSELASIFPNRFPFVAALTVRGAHLRADISEAPPHGARAIATFSPNLAVTALSYTDAYWRVHRELEAAGRLHHSFERCPERERARVVREWTPVDGWRDLHVGSEAAARQNTDRSKRDTAHRQ